MNKILLDTNAYSHLLRGDDRVYSAIIHANEIIFSVIVLGEIIAGFKGGKMEAKNNELLQKFLQKPLVNTLNVTRSTATIFASIKNALRLAGTPIPINDVWIAAHVIETDATLITFDNHFNNIEGIKIWSDK